MSAFKREPWEAPTARTPARPPSRAPVASLLRLQRMAGNSAVANLLARQPDDDKDEVTPQSIAAALAEVKVTKTEEKDSGLKPWEVFKDAIGNTETKKKLYSALKSALKDEQKAGRAVESAKAALSKASSKLPDKQRQKLVDAVPKAEKALEAASKRSAVARASLKDFIKGKIASWSPDPKLNALQKEVADAKAAAKKAKGAAAKAAQDKLTDAKKRYDERLDQLKKEVDANPMVMSEFTRNRYSIKVGDTTVSLYDHVEAYATITDKGLEGSAKKTGTGQTVDQLVDAEASISASTKKIIKLVSSFEGKFSSVNTWDIADVTWGFIQWTTGKDGKGSLIDTLLACKGYAPKAFDASLRRYGIDVTKSDGIVLTEPDGTVLKGKEAARAIQVSPVLTALLSAAGEDADFKVAQLRHANDKVGKEVLRSTVTVKGNKIKLGDILTSELAVGGAFNRAVHAGAGAVRKLLGGALQTWAEKKKIDTSKPVSQWGPDADAICIEALKGPEPTRMAKMATVLSSKPGSFK